MSTGFDLRSMPDAERQFLTKHVNWTDKLIDHNVLSKFIPLRLPDLSNNAPKVSSLSLGNLEKLPLEVLHGVFSNLSVADALSLWRVNTRSQSLFSSWRPFILVNTYGQNALRALIATQSAHKHTYSQLESVIFTSKCEICYEHGEILYLPKLLRCCFRCLSTDRRLLAVQAGYAANVLEISKSDFAKLSIYTTVPQDHHWGWSLGRHSIVDYTTALEFSRSRATTQHMVRDEYVKATTLPEELNLPEQWCSVQHRPRRSLQSRRQLHNGLPLLSLPSCVTRPPEGLSGQHAVSVLLPAMKRTRVRSAGSQKDCYKYEVQSGLHCAGCAHWWNYHSTLPHEYHSMFRGTVADMTSPLMAHLSVCIYARMYWERIQRMTGFQSMRILQRQNKFRINRSVDAFHFEYFSPEGAQMIWHNEMQPGRFSACTEWPINSSDILVSAFPFCGRDRYGDMLFGQDALSQASWATANAFSYKDLFHGPVKLVKQKRDRERQRIEKQRRQGEMVSRRGIWQGPLVFDLFA